MKANSDYRLKESIKETNAAVLILVGSKESAIMKKSAKLLCEQIPDATLEILPQYYHGDLEKIIYVFLTIFLYLLKCPQSLILSALRAFCFCGKPHISRSIFLYFRYQSWLKSW